MSTKKRFVFALAATALIAAVGVLLLTLPQSSISTPVVSGSPSGSAAGTISAVSDTYPVPVRTIASIDSGSVTMTSRTSGKYFYTLKDNTWTCTFLKGVNIGLTLPTTSLDNPDISYDTYMTWFSDITAMNANTIKVYTVMNPDFYRAFADYNETHADNPLYLLQGIWFDEDYMTSIGDALDSNKKVISSFQRAAREVTDIIHGNCSYTSYGSIKNAVYDRDISRYVVGFILGLEWQPDFVMTTNKNHAGLAQFSGAYLTTQNASPFEIFLAEVGDLLIRYETDTYKQQRPVAFLNWSTTDMLTHTNEPFKEEDAVSVNTETIRTTSQYYPGLFASLDIYPYYPEFLNYQPEYLAFTDSTGKSDPYRAYLRDLQNQYSIPVLISEFGVSTSRGEAHQSVMGYNQGGISETDQGQMDMAMAKDIALEGYAGEIIFSWQDEWFKQTWNTIKYAPDNASQRGFNVESAEQRYGIVAYEPGSKDSISYPDGDISEWAGNTPVYTNGSLALYAKSDEAYLYLKLTLPDNYSFDNGQLAVALSLTGHGSASASAYSLSFNQPTDFIILLNGKDNTRVLTDAYYDKYYYQYTVQKKLFDRNIRLEKQNSGLFNTIQTFLSNEIDLPLSSEAIAPKSYESGLLRFGNANPGSSSYDSLADFYVSNGQAEFRIPWYLLNVMDGSNKTILNNFYTAEGISFTNGTNIGMAATPLTGTSQSLILSTYSWPEIKTSTFHMRLKQSYAIIQSGFKALMSDYS